jgi:hypothetical protein
MAAKKKPVAGGKKNGGKRDMLVVGSKVKEHVRSKGLMAAGDLLEAVSNKVSSMIDSAAERVTANKRSTMRPHDL